MRKESVFLLGDIVGKDRVVDPPLDDVDRVSLRMISYIPVVASSALKNLLDPLAQISTPSIKLNGFGNYNPSAHFCFLMNGFIAFHFRLQSMTWTTVQNVYILLWNTQVQRQNYWRHLMKSGR